MFRFIYMILVNVRMAPLWVYKMRRMIKHPGRYSIYDKYSYAKMLTRRMNHTAHIKTLVYGEEKLPRNQGYVMYPNHQGKYDVVGIIYAHELPCSFVMDKAKSYSMMVREIVNLLGAKRLELNNVRQNLRIINEMASEVAEGKKFIIFSEGGYKYNHNTVQEFKPGSFKAAIKAKAPIVPVALIDTYKPFNSFSLKPVTTKVIFIDPLYYDDYKHLKSVEIAQIVKEKIIETIAKYKSL